MQRLDSFFESRLRARADWKGIMVGSIDGLERQLPSSAPKAARLHLGELRESASKASSAQARKSCERRLDSLLESLPCFRGAFRRYVGERVDSAIDVMESVMETMSRVARLQGKRKAERGITKLLVDFRKKRRKPIYKPIKPVQRT
jgi:hypothetical protein